MYVSTLFFFSDNPDQNFAAIIQSLQKLNQDLMTVVRSATAINNNLITPLLAQNAGSGTIVIDMDQAAKVIVGPIVNEIQSILDIGTEAGVLGQNMIALASEMKSL